MGIHMISGSVDRAPGFIPARSLRDLDRRPAAQHTPMVQMNTNKLVDKTRIIETLGYTFNKSGSTLPTFTRRGCLVYKARKDIHSFFEGLLVQNDKSMPIMSDSLMWVNFPVKWKALSVWVIKRDAAGYLGLKCRPSSLFSMEKKEGQARSTLWLSPTWTVAPTAIPKVIVDALNTLHAKLTLPETVTVDCLGDMIFDVHAGKVIPDLEFGREVTLHFDIKHQDRPFYDVGIDAYEMRI